MAAGSLLLQGGAILLLQGGNELLLQGTSVAATITFLVVNAPDETPTGAAVTLYAEITDDSGASLSFDAAPHIHLWRVTSAGARADVKDASMTQVGATNVWSYDFTPSGSGTYSAWVVGAHSASVMVDQFRITARPKFDPIALAVDGNLVSRM